MHLALVCSYFSPYSVDISIARLAGLT